MKQADKKRKSGKLRQTCYSAYKACLLMMHIDLHDILYLVFIIRVITDDIFHICYSCMAQLKFTMVLKRF